MTPFSHEKQNFGQNSLVLLPKNVYNEIVNTLNSHFKVLGYPLEIFDFVSGSGSYNYVVICRKYKQKGLAELMKKSTFLATIALIVAAVGVVIALAAYFKNRSSFLYDDEDDDFLFGDADDLEYYSSELEDDGIDDLEAEDGAFPSEDE